MNDFELKISRGVCKVFVFSVLLGQVKGILFIFGRERVAMCMMRAPYAVQLLSIAMIPVRKSLERGALLIGKSYGMRLHRG